MSKLTEKLNQTTKVAPQGMGFRAVTQPASMKPRLLLIANVGEGVESLAEVVAGADGVLLSKLGAGSRTLARISQALSQVPWGLRVRNAEVGRLPQITEAGCDFVVFPSSTEVAAFQNNNKVGKVLQVGSDIKETLLRVVNELPVDAVLVDRDPGAQALTWQDLMVFQLFGDLLVLPMLVVVPNAISTDELQALWNCGVDGIVVEAGAAGQIAGLARLISEAKFPLRKRRRMEPVVPVVAEAGEEVIEEEEEP